MWKNSIAAKLREADRPDLAETLELCHTEYTHALCNDCNLHRTFPNRCDSFFCPECSPRICADRREAVEWWTKLVSQPKHVVLTIRNLPEITRGHVMEFKQFWSRLRRLKFARNWRGGFYSIEVTNEGRGWHLHLHALVDAKWIDARELSRAWARVSNGAGYIVKVMDARPKSYLAELTKYIAKGSQLATWSPSEIVQFIESFEGVRTFGVFGTLYGARTKFSEYIAAIRDARPACPCGSCSVNYYSEFEWMKRDFKPDEPFQHKPPKQRARDLDLFAAWEQGQKAAAAFSR